MAIFSHLDALNSAGFSWPFMCNIPMIHCMLTSRKICYLHFLHFLHALASACELKSINQFYQLTKLVKSWHARARRTILVNARSERHFRRQSSYFGYCQISLNTEKSLFWPIFSCKCGGLTQMCSNLAICDKITRFIPFFLVVFLEVNILNS